MCKEQFSRTTVSLKTEPLISKELLTSSGSFGSILLVESIAKRV